jgi:hypothetical protein
MSRRNAAELQSACTKENLALPQLSYLMNEQRFEYGGCLQGPHSCAEKLARLEAAGGAEFPACLRCAGLLCKPETSVES